MDIMENAVKAQEPWSVFVTVIAWVFIVISGFSAVMGIMESIMFGVMLPLSHVVVPMGHMKNAAVDPLEMKHLSHIMCFAAICFAVVNAILMVTSIGLLKRKNVARIFFIVFMAIGTVCSLILLVFVGMAWRWISAHPAVQGTPPMHLFDLFSVFAMSCSIVICVLFAWVIKKLLSKDIRQEFILPAVKM